MDDLLIVIQKYPHIILPLFIGGLLGFCISYVNELGLCKLSSWSDDNIEWTSNFFVNLCLLMWNLLIFLIPIISCSFIVLGIWHFPIAGVVISIVVVIISYTIKKTCEMKREAVKK